MFIELHIIQSFPPTNLNRDDMNQPKDCEFGGVRRARISSQCLKRAIRTNPVFAATVQPDKPDEVISYRTRYLTRALRKALGEVSKPKNEIETITRAIAAAYTSKKNEMDRDDPDRTKVAVYLSYADVKWLVEEQMLPQWESLLTAPGEETAKTQENKDAKTRKSKKSRKAKDKSPLDKLVDGLIERTKNRAGAPDIALFGRMLADRPETNVDAACQVVHAISTHAVKMDTDFFTAVEELARPDETGAAMMDIAGFNCACFYRYARLDWEQLKKNLEGDTDLARRTVEAFLRASEAATPTGKKNSHDNNSRPVFMMTVARETRSPGWSLVNAFEKPVQAWGGSGLVEPSVLALDQYWNDLCQFYDKQTVKATAVALHPTFKPEGLSEALRSTIKSTLDTWVQAMLDALPQE